MKLLTISLLNSCNRGCEYCPVKKWMVPADTDRTDVNMLTNESLLAWIDAYINPVDGWIIELTGGEPGLYPEIDELVPQLASRGYVGMVKTNGDHPIARHDAFPLISAWHGDIDCPPAESDIILIIKNPHDNWQAKAQKCERENWVYKTVNMGVSRDIMHLGAINKITHSLHVNSSGQITDCAAGKINPESTIFNNSDVAPKDLLKDTCIRCKNVTDVERLLPQNIRERVKQDYDNEVADFSANIRLSL